MTYDLNLNESNQVMVNIYLPDGLNNVSLILIDHTKAENTITDYTLSNNQITYIIPSDLYEIEGDFSYYVIADNYKSENIELNSHICDEKNKCHLIELTSGGFCICIKKNCKNILTGIISPTVPTTGEEVWIQKGKNLFNKSLNIVVGFSIDSVGIIVNVDGAFFQNVFIPVKSLEFYTLSTTVESGRLEIVEYDENYNFIIRNIERTTKHLTIKTKENTAFVRICAMVTNLDTLQLEQSDTVTDYEPFTRKIHIKNDNGGYEDFYNEEEHNKRYYSTGETRIGTYLYKPLYSQTFYIGTVTSNQLVIGNIPNLNLLVNKFAPTKRNDIRLSLIDIWGNANGDIAISDDKLTEMTDISVTVEYTKTTD